MESKLNEWMNLLRGTLAKAAQNGDKYGKFPWIVFSAKSLLELNLVIKNIVIWLRSKNYANDNVFH